MSLPVNAGLGVALYFARQYREAIRQLLKTLELDDRYAPAHAFLGWAYTASGMSSEAIAAGERALALMGAPWVIASLGHAQARAGDRDAAQRAFAELLARANNQYVSPYDVAVMQAVLGHHQEALRSLEAAYEEAFGRAGLGGAARSALGPAATGGHLRESAPPA